MRSFLSKIAAKSADNSLPALTIVALGDSVTQGVMAQRQLEPASTYHRQLQVELESFFPTCTFNVVNSGIAGESAVQALGRLERDVLRYGPDLVLIGFGLNDSIGGEAGEAAFCDAISRMIREIQATGESDIIILTPPFMATRESGSIHPEHREFAPVIIQAQTGGALARYAERLREIASQHGIPVADVHAEWARIRGDGLDTDLWLTNALNHPNRQGHRIAATLLFHKIIAEHLNASK